MAEEVEEVGMVEVEVEVEVEEILTEPLVKTNILRGLIFAKEVAMLKMIVGSRENLNATIVKNLATCRRIVESKQPSKQAILKEKKVKQACFMHVKVHLSSKIVCGSLTVAAQTI